MPHLLAQTVLANQMQKEMIAVVLKHQVRTGHGMNHRLVSWHLQTRTGLYFIFHAPCGNMPTRTQFLAFFNGLKVPLPSIISVSSWLQL